MAEAPATKASGARRIFGNTILLTAGQGVGLVSMAVWTVLVARYIGPDLYGYYAFAQAVVSVLVIFVGMGLDEVTTRDVAQRPALGRSYLVTFGLAKLVAAVFVLGGFLAMSLAGDASGAEVPVVAIVTAMGAVQALNSLVMALLYAQDQMASFVIGQSANYLVTMTSGLVAIWLDRSFATILAFSLVASLVQLVLTSLAARRKLARPQERAFAAAGDLKRVARRAFPFAAVALVSVLQSNLLIILLGASDYSDEALGQFGAAQRLAMIILIVPSMIAQVLVPAFARAHASDPVRFAGMFERAYRYVVFGAVPAAGALAVVAPSLLELVFGSEFAGGGDTLRVLALILVGAPTYVLGPALVAMDRQGLVARVHAANLVAVGIAAWLLIPSFGAEGAAAALAVGSVASLVLYSRIVYGKLQLAYPAAWVVKTLVASGVTVVVCALAQERVHFLLVLVVVAPVVYAAANLVLRTLSASDWQYVRSVVAPARDHAR